VRKRLRAGFSNVGGETGLSIFDHGIIRQQMLQAWTESQPGTPEAHEEGGFVLQDTSGLLSVERWPRGAQNEIFVPPHPIGKRGESLIVATFHTHPNIGPEFQQEPSLTDIRAVQFDPNLSHFEYEGEYVIADQLIYRIEKNGRVTSCGERGTILTPET
jgi:hypothetical protein